MTPVASILIASPASADPEAYRACKFLSLEAGYIIGQAINKIQTAESLEEFNGKFDTTKKNFDHLQKIKIYKTEALKHYSAAGGIISVIDKIGCDSTRTSKYLSCSTKAAVEKDITRNCPW